MYQIDLRRQAYKDLESIPADYARLISNHIDSLEGNPRPHNSKKLKGIDGRVGGGIQYVLAGLLRFRRRIETTITP